MDRTHWQYWHWVTVYGLARYLAHLEQRKYRVYRYREGDFKNMWACEPTNQPGG